MEKELYAALVSAARDLAQYASYAEIVGAIGHNRSQIRKGCDDVFDALRGLEKLEGTDEEQIDG